MVKRKREKSEDFIGWESEDGKLEVIGIYEKSSHGKHTLFKVTCTECSKDKELFPDGYFVSRKLDLIRGQKPCGCSKKTEWKDWQYLILTRRAAKDRFIVHGFAEKFKGAHTKLNLECTEDGHKWAAVISSVIRGQGCPRCAGNIRLTEQEALQNCIDICKEMDYEPVGFVEGCYKGSLKTRFKYICKLHGKQNVSYTSFVNNNRRCAGCARDDSGFYGYYPKRKEEQDYLYILNFNDEFIKVGRSFYVDERINGLKYESGVPKSKIHKLRIFTATHQEIYNLEQEIHNELRERNFQYYQDWSTECFDKDC